MKLSWLFLLIDKHPTLIARESRKQKWHRYGAIMNSQKLLPLPFTRHFFFQNVHRSQRKLVAGSDSNHQRQFSVTTTTTFRRQSKVFDIKLINVSGEVDWQAWAGPGQSQYEPQHFRQGISQCQSRTFTSDQFDDTTDPWTDMKNVLPVQDRIMYLKLVDYRTYQGDCHVPSENSQRDRKLRKELGVSDQLMEWICKQRKRHMDLMKGRIKNEFERHKILFLANMLESIGFMWSEREARWQRSFNRLVKYNAYYKTTNVEKKEDPQLWSWAAAQRKAYQQRKLSKARINLLEGVGFVFDLQEASWWNYFEQICDFAKKNGSPDVPTQSKDHPSLGAWVARQRRQYLGGELSNERIKALESIGFLWDVHEKRWDQYYNELVTFHREHGHTRVPVAMGQLWQWVERQRRQLRQQANEGQENDTDNTEKIAALNQINFDWSVAADEDRAKRLMELTFSVAVQEERWVEHYKKLCAFKERFGHFVVPPTKNHELASWVKNQRFSYNHGRLSPERIAALDEIEFAWTGQAARWDRLYQQLVEFQAEHGHTRIPTRQRELYRWITQQRKELRDLADNQQECRNPKLLALEEILDDE